MNTSKINYDNSFNFDCKRNYIVVKGAVNLMSMTVTFYNEYKIDSAILLFGTLEECEEYIKNHKLNEHIN